MSQEKLVGESKEVPIGEQAENNASNSHKILTHCPYCKGKVVKRGIRKKKFEEIQVYYCKNCNKKITPLITKHKTYPLKLIMDSLTLYNRLNSLEEASKKIAEQHGIKITAPIISRWLKEYEQYIPFLRMRAFIAKKYDKKEIIEESKLFHQQIYSFKYHRAKLDLIMNEEFRHYRFNALKEFLELVTTECPNQIFQNANKRASEFKNIFNLEQVKFIPKNNAAVKTANFVTQAVSNNRLRHEILQDFMLSNDSVTVAVEIPLLMNSDDIRHYKHELNYNVPIELNDGEYVTGHADLIQVRNGSIYLMDYKPSANKEKPIDQLTLYALALSRLTGIRLYHMKCALFDEENYFEFFPLHVVYKLKKKKWADKKQKRLNELKE